MKVTQNLKIFENQIVDSMVSYDLDKLLDSERTSLDLGGNGIGAEGAKALTEALKYNNGLTSLDIGPEATKALTEAFEYDNGNRT